MNFAAMIYDVINLRRQGFTLIPSIKTSIAEVQHPGEYFSVWDAIHEILSGAANAELNTQNLQRKMSEAKGVMRQVRFLGLLSIIFLLTSLMIFVLALAHTPVSALQMLCASIFLILSATSFSIARMKRDQMESASQVSVEEVFHNHDEGITVFALLSDMVIYQIGFYGQQADGQYVEYPKNLSVMKNWKAFILAGPHYKSLLFMEGYFPPKGHFCLRSEIKNLKIPLYDFEIESTLISGNGDPENECSEAKHSQLTVTKKSEVVKESPVNRLEILLTHDRVATRFLMVIEMLGNYLELPRAVKVTVPRMRWVNLVQCIRLDPFAWENLRSNFFTTSHYAVELRKELYFALYGDKPPQPDKTDIVKLICRSQHKPFEKWLLELERFTLDRPEFETPLDFSDKSLLSHQTKASQTQLPF